ncbi:MAG TPA: hypothetical protein VGE00_07065 [Gammaproteobacteria bacterium]
MLRKIAKSFAWIIGGAFGLAVLFYLVLLVINWRDVPPSAEALRFTQMYVSRPHISDEMNAFVFMTGMSVVPEHDPMLAGIAMIDAARQYTVEKVMTEYSHPSYPQIIFRDALNKEILEYIDSCKSLDEKCLALLENKSLPGIQPNSNEAVLVNRYRELIRLPEWQDVYPRGLSGPMPSFGPAMDGQRLSMLDIWKTAESRGAKTTIAMLDEDARFWRKVLATSDSLITSMVAVSSLKRNLYWTNHVIKRLSDNNASVEVPPIWLNPITDKERLMESAWVGEWAMSEQLLRGVSDGSNTVSDDNNPFATGIGSWLGLPLLQEQDTINHRAEELSLLIKKYNVKYDELPSTAARFIDGTDVLGYEEIKIPDILYNPLGKVLNFVGVPMYPSYMNRVPDLEGSRRALLATHQLRSDKIPRDKVVEALAASPYRNPYTHQPFVWDEVSGNVVFEGLSEGKSRRSIFPY